MVTVLSSLQGYVKLVALDFHTLLNGELCAVGGLSNSCRKNCVPSQQRLGHHRQTDHRQLNAPSSSQSRAETTSDTRNQCVFNTPQRFGCRRPSYESSFGDCALNALRGWTSPCAHVAAKRRQHSARVWALLLKRHQHSAQQTILWQTKYHIQGVEVWR